MDELINAIAIRLKIKLNKKRVYDIFLMLLFNSFIKDLSKTTS